VLMILLIGSPKTNPKIGDKEIDLMRKKMTNTARRRKSKDTDGKFFLYVAFHSVFTAIANLFRDDD